MERAGEDDPARLGEREVDRAGRPSEAEGRAADADADRAFVRDVLGFDGVDAGEGWLIFKLPPAEMSLHPTDGEPTSELYLMCDDIDQLLERLGTQGVEIVRPVSDQG